MFRFDKLTQKAQEGLQQAQSIAEQTGNQVIHPAHLLIALLQEREGIVSVVLSKLGIQPAGVLAEAQRVANGLSKVTGQPPGTYISQPLQAVLEQAFDEAGHFKDEFVSTEHLLLSLSDSKNDPAGQLLNRAGATHDKAARIDDQRLRRQQRFNLFEP